MKKQILYSVSLIMALVFISSILKQTGSGGKQYKMQAPASGSSGSCSVQADNYSSDVALKWIDMQLELMRTSSPFIGGLPPSRVFAYTGIALYEAIVPGMPAYQSLSGQLADMPAMPGIVPGFAYHWPACANAALAAMNRSFFPNTSDYNKKAMNSLENELNMKTKLKRATRYFSVLYNMVKLWHNWFSSGRKPTVLRMRMRHILHP